MPYTNTEQDWIWLSKAAKAARWLRYIPFEVIVDKRNDEPVVRTWTRSRPQSFVSVNFDVTVPDADDLAPEVGLFGFDPTNRIGL